MLPGTQFEEHHCGIVDAPAQQVWDALRRLRWADLRLGRPLLLVRGFVVPVASDSIVETFTERAGAVLQASPPESLLLVMIGQPWLPVPRHRPASSLGQVRGFGEPGWLKYGMEWQLTPLDGERTLVETRTCCEATDAGARRRFGLYWAVIRRFSGLLRQDMIGSLQRAVA